MWETSAKLLQQALKKAKRSRKLKWQGKSVAWHKKKTLHVDTSLLCTCKWGKISMRHKQGMFGYDNIVGKG